MGQGIGPFRLHGVFASFGVRIKFFLAALFRLGSAEDPYLIKQFNKKYEDVATDTDGNFNPNGMITYVTDKMSEKDQEKFS